MKGLEMWLGGLMPLGSFPRTEKRKIILATVAGKNGGLRVKILMNI